MLLSFDSDMINKFKIILNPISTRYITKTYFNNQELIFQEELVILIKIYYNRDKPG